MIWWRRIKKMLKYLLLAFGVLALFVLIINIWVVRSAASHVYESADEIPPANVAVLLGTSRLVGGRKNVFFFTRIEAAAQLYKSGKVKKIIVSGDNSEMNYNETDDMRRELVKLGVPDEVIVNDHAGFRTLDSVLRAKLVFGQERIIVVSQRFHIQRAVFIAKAHGIDADGYVAADPALRSAFYKVMAREYLARVKAFLDCYILGTEPRFPGPPEPLSFP
jgi:SanA protein